MIQSNLNVKNLRVDVASRQTNTPHMREHELNKHRVEKDRV